jgi:ubiquinone/menaquinone biosynthesis C-methylase UbiE
VFKQRAQECEYLDRQDCDPVIAAASYRFMEKANRYFGGIHLVRRFIESEIKAHRCPAPVRILDIGSGSCDIPIAISKWARKKSIPVQITCLELSDHAVCLAREACERSGEGSLTVLQEDIFTYEPDQPYDYAVASMCFHHFDDKQIVALLHKLRACVCRAILVNDLHRTLPAWLGTCVASMFSHTGVKHDSRLSIRRGFKIKELRELLQHVDGATVSVKAAWLYRVYGVLRFKQDETT